MNVSPDTLDKKKYLGSYEDLIKAFIENGYETKLFDSSIEPKNHLILRHDIDFDCQYANEIACVENSLGVKASYFFLLTNDSYNLLSQKNKSRVFDIKEKGHRISLHFDPIVYGADFLEGFRYEREVFERTFQTKIEIVSIHRPTEFFLNYDEKLDDVEHTYQKKYFKDLKYMSDSGGNFRFGHPLEDEDFARKNSIQLLIHPIWWRSEGNSNIEVLKNHIENQKTFLHSHIGENCKPFQEYLDKK